jgi:hypothetical protein
MPKTLCVLGIALALAQQGAPSAPAPAALKTTIRMSVEKTDAPLVTPDGKPSPYGNFGPLVAQLLTPNGPVDIAYTISGDESRAEVQGRLAALPAGSVVLQKLGENVIRVVNPSNKTWYEIPANQNLGTLLGAPDVTIEPMKETATIAGQHADRFRFSETLHVPVPEGTTLPPEFPSDLQLSGDLWSTDAFSGSGYKAVFRTLQAFAAIPGVEALTAGGRFPLRIVLRSSVMPGYEIRSEVTSIGPATPDPSAFAVPAGYQKVQSPVGGGGQLPTPQFPTPQ